MGRLFRKILVVVAITTLAACASAPKIDSMVATVPSLIPPEHIRSAISVDSVLGGEKTNPMWSTKLSSDEFRGALTRSLENAGMLSELDTSGKYRLRVTLEELNQPLGGLGMTVSSDIHYRLEERQGGAVVINETISSSYTAEFSDHFVGTERLRMATEGAARKNIEAFIKRVLETNRT